jgi:hypothetical protein
MILINLTLRIFIYACISRKILSRCNLVDLGAIKLVMQSVKKSPNVHVSWGVLQLRSRCVLDSTVRPESGYSKRIS